VHWAKTYLGKAGLIEATRRGHFKITTRGQQVIASRPERIDNAFLGQFDEFKQFREKSAHPSGEDTDGDATPALVNRTETPDEIMRVAHRQIEISLAQELLDRILTALPIFLSVSLSVYFLAWASAGLPPMPVARSGVAATTGLTG
jgi:restriction system protein